MKEHVEVLQDSFVDFMGKTHHFVIAAVSKPLITGSGELPDINYPDDYFQVIEKGLSIGISICNPEDEYVEKIGVMKAVARARSSNPVLFVTLSGYINGTLVKAFLKQEAEYLKNNPNVYIAGYDEAKERYLKKKQIEEIKDSFTEVEKVVVENMQKDPRFLDNVNTYLTWLDNQNKCKKHGK